MSAIGHAMELQRAYNHALSMQAEALALSPKCPYIYIVPWWRLDLRIRDWMTKWDYRFSCRKRKHE